MALTSKQSINGATTIARKDWWALRFIHEARNSTRTPLIYLIGVSGLGKDSLLNYLRDHPLPDQPFHVAMRY